MTSASGNSKGGSSSRTAKSGMAAMGKLMNSKVSEAAKAKANTKAKQQQKRK